ncbi:unnamed protein product [Prunus armeniaca]
MELKLGLCLTAEYVTVVAFIVVLFLYISSLAAVNILQAHITSDLGEFMNKITSYLEFLPPSYYCLSLFQPLGDAAVVRRAYGKLKELMNSRLPEEWATLISTTFIPSCLFMYRHFIEEEENRIP